MNFAPTSIPMCGQNRTKILKGFYDFFMGFGPVPFPLLGRLTFGKVGSCLARKEAATSAASAAGLGKQCTGRRTGGRNSLPSI